MARKTLEQHNREMAEMRRQIAEDAANNQNAMLANGAVFDEVMDSPATFIGPERFDKSTTGSREKLRKYADDTRARELARHQGQAQTRTTEQEQDAARAQKQSQIDRLRSQADQLESEIYGSFDAEPYESADESIHDESIDEYVEQAGAGEAEWQQDDGRTPDPAVVAAAQALQQ